jgi:ribosome-binding protein aMBF1 (putative translation factor)
MTIAKSRCDCMNKSCDHNHLATDQCGSSATTAVHNRYKGATLNMCEHCATHAIKTTPNEFVKAA